MCKIVGDCSRHACTIAQAVVLLLGTMSLFQVKYQVVGYRNRPTVCILNTYSRSSSHLVTSTPPCELALVRNTHNPLMAYNIAPCDPSHSTVMTCTLYIRILDKSQTERGLVRITVKWTGIFLFVMLISPFIIRLFRRGRRENELGSSWTNQRDETTVQ